MSGERAQRKGRSRRGGVEFIIIFEMEKNKILLLIVIQIDSFVENEAC